MPPVAASPWLSWASRTKLFKATSRKQQLDKLHQLCGTALQEVTEDDLIGKQEAPSSFRNQRPVRWSLCAVRLNASDFSPRGGGCMRDSVASAREFDSNGDGEDFASDLHVDPFLPSEVVDSASGRHPLGDGSPDHCD